MSELHFFSNGVKLNIWENALSAVKHQPWFGD